MCKSAAAARAALALTASLPSSPDTCTPIVRNRATTVSSREVGTPVLRLCMRDVRGFRCFEREAVAQRRSLVVSS